MAGKTTEEGRARIEPDEFDRELLFSDPAAEEAAQVLQDAGRSPYASSDDATIAGVWDLDPANGVFEAPADMPERVPRAVSIDGGPEFGAWAAATSDGRVEANAAGCVAARFDLTPREREILVLLAQNYRAPYIAEKLVVSQSTVKTHMRNLYGKLDVHSQAELLLGLDEEAQSITTD